MLSEILTAINQADLPASTRANAFALLSYAVSTTNPFVSHDPGIYLSNSGDWALYAVAIEGGTPRLVSNVHENNYMHFLHGVSPDGQQLAFVGVNAEQQGQGLRFISAEICTMAADGTGFRQITRGGAPADGPEYSPDGQWIYFNTEAFSANAQIARMRPDGSEVSRLTFSDTVDWFPHLSPDGKSAVYLAYPPGTKGHPADLWVELRVVRDGQWQDAKRAVKLFGGQGTINVNSWSPDSRKFAYVTYPTTDA